MFMSTYLEFRNYLLTIGATREYVEDVLERIQDPVIMDDHLYVPDTFMGHIDENEAYVNGIIVKYMVLSREKAEQTMYNIE